MMCAGAIYCKIYRDKRYCKKEHTSHNQQPCACRHAALRCDVEYCGFADMCLTYKQKHGGVDDWQHVEADEA